MLVMGSARPANLTERRPPHVPRLAQIMRAHHEERQMFAMRRSPAVPFVVRNLLACRWVLRSAERQETSQHHREAGMNIWKRASPVYARTRDGSRAHESSPAPGSEPPRTPGQTPVPTPRFGLGWQGLGVLVLLA